MVQTPLGDLTRWLAMVEDLLTERLRLRPWTLEDLIPLSALFAKPEVWRYPFGRGFTAEETEAFLTRRLDLQENRGLCERAVESRSGGLLIGYIGITMPDWLPEAMPTPEIGWRLDPSHWGRGLATEGARACLTDGFTVLDIPEVMAIYEPQNTASGRVMQRLGMQFDRDTVDPERGIPLRFYRISRAEWAARESIDA
jgi:RimJ/RimL family protein N-acetyltransferase